MKVKSENEVSYAVGRPQNLPDYVINAENAIIERALEILHSRMVTREFKFDSPDVVKNFLKLKLGQLEHEVFCILFLDSQHQLIQYEEMFRGTVTQTSVYPREVVKMALALNASAVILCHNHPSGSGVPSRADETITQTLKTTLALIDARILDHFIVAGASQVTSMAELGLI